MAQTALARKSSQALSKLASYAELRRRVRETLLWGRQAVEEARVRTYWETGWWIKEHILLNRHRARYGEKVLGKLSRDESVSESVLDRCKQFSEKFPDLFPKPISAGRQKLVLTPYPTLRNGIKSQLTWTHYRTLLPLEDDKLRRRLVRQAARHGWSVPELVAQIKSLSAREKGGIESLGTAQDSRPRIALLQPKKGELFTYRIIEDGGVLALDHGFASYWNLSGEEAKEFREGDIVRKPPGGEMEKLKEGTKSLLYTYEAEATRVVDGDTIWMKIYLEGRSRPPWVKEKLRLRDIDAPELKTPEGRAAKKFVEEEVRGQPGQAAIRGSIKQARAIRSGKRILITTTKPDKWDRYLSDVFLIPASGEESQGSFGASAPQDEGPETPRPPTYLNNLLLETGDARLKTDWSLDDWGA